MEANNFPFLTEHRDVMATGTPTYKIILLGEYGVGKSSIFRRFLNGTFKEETGKKSTIGLDQCSQTFGVNGLNVKRAVFHLHVYSGRDQVDTQLTEKEFGMEHREHNLDDHWKSMEFWVTLWDTGGMERMSFIGSSFYRGAHAALLCYSVKNKDTFSVLSQYILDIVINAEGAKIFLCGNMADGDGEDQVDKSDIENFERECGNVLSGVYQISCKDNFGIFEMFKDIARVLHQESVGRMTLRRELGNVIRPGITPESDEHSKKRCCSSS